MGIHRAPRRRTVGLGQDRHRGPAQAILKDAVKSAKGADAYPEGDFDALAKIIDAGDYGPYTEAGLTPKDVTQVKVRQMVRAALTTTSTTTKDRKALKDAGVSMMDDMDVDVLLSGLTYKADKELKEIEFGWTYRWADAAKPPETADKDKIAKLLKDLLASAFVTGGGSSSLRVDKGDFASYFSKPIADLVPKAQIGFAIAQLTPTVLSEMVSQYVRTRKPAQAATLKDLILVNSIHDLNVLTFDPEKVAFELDIPTNPDLDAALKPAEEKQAVELVKELLTLAFTKPVGGDIRTLSKDDLKKITDAITNAKIKILPLKESKDKAKLIAFEREVREKQAETDRRLRELEERIANLPNSQPQAAPVAQPYIRYEVQRTGVLGCRRVLVPVVVYP